MILPFYGSAFHWNAMGQRLGKIREQLEAQPFHLSVVAWAIAEIQPACEIPLERLQAYDEGVARAQLQRVVKRATRERR